MKKIADVTAEGSTYEISIVKLIGKPISDIVGYLTNEFGDATFQMCRVVFEDGTDLWCEGEHDLPYLTNSSTKQPNFDDETLKAIYEQEKQT